jgi:transglutaminase-like putative cysteine protease
VSAQTSTQLSGQQARQTLRVLAGCALGVLPLLQLLTDTGWLVQAWICMAIVITPAALLRLRWRANVAQLLPGLAVLVCYLTRVYAPVHTWAWAFPTRATWTDVSALSSALGTTVSDSVAPLTSTPPIRLYLSLGLVLFAVIADVITVELRRPALAGVPLLLIFTLAGAVPREAVSWLWFGLAAGGYLLILSAAASDALLGWGRLVAREGRSTSSRLSSALSGRRIGFTAIIIAVALPFLLPSGSADLVSNALHNGRPGVGGNGSGTGGVSIDPLASLRGQLTRGAPINLFRVTVNGTGSASAYYLRTTVLDAYNGSAWVPGQAAATVPAQGSGFVAQPSVLGPTITTERFNATVTVEKLAGTPPLFAAPVNVTALPGSWNWNPRAGLIQGKVRSGQQYSETVVQPAPSLAQLETASANPTLQSPSDANEIREDLSVKDIPAQVNELVTQLTAGKTTPVDKAEALLDYFRNPANGFVYSLQTKSGDSGSELVDFLTTGRAGYCQQYAAAMGAMLRVANIPARVVLGYTHEKPDASGRFEVTTDDAHAWVEAYFAGVGWVPFDPTPLTGTDAARVVALPWNAPASQGSVDSAFLPKPGIGSQTATTKAAAAPAAKHAAGVNAGPIIRVSAIIVGAVLVLALLFALPLLWRARRRRRRLRHARAGGLEPLWDELADTVRDTGLGWSPARTSRQVAAWLAEFIEGEDARQALHRLAAGVERERYSPSTARADAAGAIDDLLRVRNALLHSSALRTGLRARLLPKSLRARGTHAGAGASAANGQQRKEKAGAGSRTGS